MERVVDYVRAACPNARHGCAATPVYGRDNHLRVCLHAPSHCLGEACGFTGSTAALLDQIKAAHGWASSLTEADANDNGHGDAEYTLLLHDGFNFLVAACGLQAATRRNRSEK
jgi:E3 ubiquitin-protein ligase SIAH1